MTSARGVLGLLALVACTPTTFDGLVGGQPAPGEQRGTGNPFHSKREDLTLSPPRHLSPLPVSWVNTSRPRLRWKLASGSTGAVVVLSTKRDFSENFREYEVDGEELVVPEDLEPGIWFWQLVPQSESASGRPSTIVWELLVRGPSRNGASDAAVGRISDVNGDGFPDLTYSLEERDPGVPGAPSEYVLTTQLGQPNDRFALEESFPSPLYRLDPSLATGTDLDGDGFTDLAYSDMFDGKGSVYIEFGSPYGYDPAKERSSASEPRLPPFMRDVSVEGAGDLNGDGYGDLALAIPTMSFVGFGTAKGLAGMQIFAPADATIPSLSPGADLDGDGFSDLAIARAPLSLLRGSPERFEATVPLSLGTMRSMPARARAFAVGDFDGDGKSELAFATAIGGMLAVCIAAPGKGALSAGACWMDTAAPTHGERTIAAGDLDADGQDELLVLTSTGIKALTHVGGPYRSTDSKFEAKTIAGSAGAAALTVVHPGRPGPARWAISASGDVAVFEGTSLVQKLGIGEDPWMVKLGPTLR
jgi:hypothetical protein